MYKYLKTALDNYRSKSLSRSKRTTLLEMQATADFSNAAMAASPKKLSLRDKKVKDLTSDQKRLVEVPYTATLAHTMNALVANQVVAVPVAAPPGQWIGAGGSMIVEADKHTGVVRKHYIGMVTMLDILVHIAGNDKMDREDLTDVDQKMSVPTSSVIGHSLESLSLWTLNPSTSILDCMEVFSKGIHRALVPSESVTENIAGVELVESASSYHMLTQMDVLRFLREHLPELQGVISKSVEDLGAITEQVFAVTNQTKVIDAIKNMRAGALNAVPVVEAMDFTGEDHAQLVNGRGRRLIETFSATDLKGCPISQLNSWLSLTVTEFIERAWENPIAAASTAPHPTRKPTTCHPQSTLAEAIDKAVLQHVHRIWVVNPGGALIGLVSLTDMIRVIRAWLTTDSNTMIKYI